MVFMGHSMGADSALWIAAEAPEIVRAAVLEEPLYSHNGTRIKDFAVYSSLLAFQEAMAVSNTSEGITIALKRARPNWPEALLQSKAECLSKLDSEVLNAIVDGRHTHGYDTEDLLPRIESPMLIIQGNPSRGGLLNDDEAEHMASLIDNCTLVQMPGDGHEPHSRQPGEFVKVAKAFLDAL